MVPVTDLNVKSVIATPNGWTKPGRVRISGAAWSNSSPVSGVDVSVDGGTTWKPAKLGKDQSRYAWRLWELDWKAPEGKHTLLARAKNAAGQIQPLSQEWNPSGYLWNVAQRVEVEVSSKDHPRAADDSKPSPQPTPLHPPQLPSHTNVKLSHHSLSI